MTFIYFDPLWATHSSLLTFRASMTCICFHPSWADQSTLFTLGVPRLSQHRPPPHIPQFFQHIQHISHSFLGCSTLLCTTRRPTDAVTSIIYSGFSSATGPNTSLHAIQDTILPSPFIYLTPTFSPLFLLTVTSIYLVTFLHFLCIASGLPSIPPLPPLFFVSFANLTPYGHLGTL